MCAWCWVVRLLQLPLVFPFYSFYFLKRTLCAPFSPPSPTPPVHARSPCDQDGFDVAVNGRTGERRPRHADPAINRARFAARFPGEVAAYDRYRRAAHLAAALGGACLALDKVLARRGSALRRLLAPVAGLAGPVYGRWAHRSTKAVMQACGLSPDAIGVLTYLCVTCA